MGEYLPIFMRDQPNSHNSEQKLALWMLKIPFHFEKALCATADPRGEGLGRTTIKDTVVDLGSPILHPK